MERYQCVGVAGLVALMAMHRIALDGCGRCGAGFKVDEALFDDLQDTVAEQRSVDGFTAPRV